MHIIEEWLKRRKRKNGKRGRGKEKWKGRKRGAREIFSAIGASASCSSLQIQRQSTSYGLFLLVSGRAPRMIWETRLPNHLFRSRAAPPKAWHTITPQSFYEIVSQRNPLSITYLSYYISKQNNTTELEQNSGQNSAIILLWALRVKTHSLKDNSKSNF